MLYGMIRWTYASCLISCFLLCNSARCEEFVHNMDMNGDYAKYVYRVEKMRVWDEKDNGLPVRYWGPSKTGQEGTLIYRYQFDTPIVSASVMGNILKHIPTDKVSIEVSSDDKEYVLLTEVRHHPKIEPPYSVTRFDLTEYVRGKKSVYLRVKLTGTQINTSITTAQFLRTAEDQVHFLAPYVYEFKAVTE
ncbi:hypothetical protein [Rosistilla oblonga]|uniref:hypothetical protein n=1 Tax=Rosistilla oblonga TaxID=2527990 RepID=UPI003A97F014